MTVGLSEIAAVSKEDTAKLARNHLERIFLTFFSLFFWENFSPKNFDEALKEV
jgi:hypothetical protein